MINDFIGKGMTLVYGEAATGKTTLAMQLSFDTTKNKRVIFLDSEKGFSIERFKQIAGEDYKKHLEKIFLLKVDSFDEQTKSIKKFSDVGDVGLVVVDTIGMYYRLEVRKNYSDANSKLDKQMKILKELTRKGVNVLINTQVYSDVENEKIKNVGGNMLRNWCDVIIKLEKTPRKLIIEKPNKKEFVFDIKNEGLVI